MRAFLVFASLWMVSQSAFATKIVGNGGDVYALEFVAVASDVYDYLKDNSIEGISLPKFKDVILNTKIESTDESLNLNGMPKDAINFPSEKKIVFSRLRWTQISEMQKPAIVLHEYLGVLGIDDSSYKFSQPLLSSLSYGKNVTEVKGPFTVNFATDSEYALNAHVVLENFGPKSWHYNASNEKIRIIIDFKGKRKVFLLPARGRIISAWSGTDGEDDGLNISILQPLVDAKGKPQVMKENGSEYIPHVVRDYRLEFTSPTKDDIPDAMDFVGPVSNMAG